jgi:hypothetical protein
VAALSGASVTITNRLATNSFMMRFIIFSSVIDCVSQLSSSKGYINAQAFLGTHLLTKTFYNIKPKEPDRAMSRLLDN